MRDAVLEHELLQDHYAIEEAEALQIKWLERVQNEEENLLNIEDVKYIAGVDISFPKTANPKWGLACAVLWDYNENKLIKHEFAKGDLKFPYIPGFLGFRENKLIARAILKLPQKPDVIMCDGHGIIHPKRFGDAVHLGVALNIPSFGVAKNPFVGNSDWNTLARKKGEKTPVWINELENENLNDRETLGVALCVTDNCKPVFVSTGYRITLDTSLQIALGTSINHRQPEPIFYADHLSRKELKKEIKI